MSGSRRTIAFDENLESTRAFLVVDPSTLKREKRTITVPIRVEKSRQPSYEFEHERLTAEIVEVLYDEDGMLAPGPVTVLSVSAQRSKTWNYYVAFNGSRKIMYFDENDAFDQPVGGPKALLLLKGRDDSLDAWNASMGEGLLPITRLDEIRSHLASRE